MQWTSCSSTTRLSKKCFHILEIRYASYQPDFHLTEVFFNHLEVLAENDLVLDYSALPVFIGLLIHHWFRSKKIINMFHSFGLGVGYSRVLQIEKHTASSLSEQYETEGAVVPKILKKNTFTIGALDNRRNADHLPRLLSVYPL